MAKRKEEQISRDDKPRLEGFEYGLGIRFLATLEMTERDARNDRKRCAKRQKEKLEITKREA